MHDDDTEATNAGEIALTSFPSLTGLQSHVSGSRFLTETYQFECAVSDLQRVADRDNVPLAALFQAAWVKVLSTYTGPEQEIKFLSSIPESETSSKSCPSRLELNSFHQEEAGSDNFSQSLRQIFGQTSHVSIERQGKLKCREEKGNCSQNGSLLDLKYLCRPPDDLNTSKAVYNYCSSYGIGLVVHVVASEKKVLHLASSSSDRLNDAGSARLMLKQIGAAIKSFTLRHDQLFNREHSYDDLNLISISNHPPATLKPSSSLQSQFEDWVKIDPQRIALEFYTSIDSEPLGSYTQWTYGELDRRAGAVASRLQHLLGPLANQIIPICMDRCPDIYIAILGILKAGAAWCPIDPSFPPRRRHDLISRAEASLLILNDRSPKDGIPENVTAVNVTNADQNLANPSKPPYIDPDHHAYLIWTSGTTGPPKGVPVSHRAAAASMRSLQACVPTDVKKGNVRCVQFSQSTFDVFVQDLLYTWGVGGTLISAVHAIVLGSFAELTTQTRATHAHLTPAFAASIPRKTCPTLEVVTMIGEKLTQNVANDWSEDCRLYNTYGPAENAVVSTVRHVPHGDIKLSANIGLPLPSVSAFVIRDGEVMIRNGIGELALGGPQLSQGYWKDPARTSERFVWNERLQTLLYMTGDIVRQLHDGSFEFVGRTDDLVKIQGIRIELSEIAFALRSCHPKVQQVEILFSERPDRPSKVIVAFLSAPSLSKSGHQGTIADDKSVDIAETALRVAKAELPDYMIPKVFLVIGAIPRTSSAKVDRTVMRQMYVDSDLGAWEERLAPKDDELFADTDFDSQDMMLMDLISKLTGTAIFAMARRSTLSSVGVDSLTATRLATRLQKDIPNISVAGILACQTLRDLLRTTKQGYIDDDEDRYDLSAFHNETSKYLNPTIAKRVGLTMPVLPIQESLLSESLRNALSYWSNSLYALDTQIDLRRLEGAWESSARSMSALRTAFYPVAEASELRNTQATFLQVIYEKAVVDWAILSGGGSSLEEQVKIRALVLAERHQRERFTEPPWAVTIFLCESRRVMMFSIHHSVRDEPSLPLIMADLSHQYLGKSKELHSQRSQLQNAISLLHINAGQHRRDEEFWATCLSDYHDLEDAKLWPELKVANREPSQGSVTYSWCAPVPYRCLEIGAKNAGAPSVASLLRIVWGCLLLEYLETDKVVFGETLSLRGKASTLANIVGPLISVIPVPFQALGTSRQMLNDITNSQRERHKHSGIHPRVIRRLLGRSGRSSLYPAVFNFVPNPADQNLEACQGLWQEMHDIVGLSVEHSVALNAYTENDGALRLEIVASRQHLDLPHVYVLAKQIDAFMEIILQHPDEPLISIIKHMPIDSLSTTHSEDFEANSAWSRLPTTQVDYYASLHPDWTAAKVVDSLDDENVASKEWSYEQLHKAYRNVAVQISDSGCFKQTIAVCLDRRLEVYAVILAILSTGNTYLPIAEDLPHERKAFLLKDSDATLLFTTKSLVTSFFESNQPCRKVLVEDIDYSKQCQVITENTPKPTDHAYLLYTSGSTGTPKGVLVSRGNLMSFIGAISSFIGSHVNMATLQGRGKWLGMASYAFDVHLLEMFFPWHHGMATITAPRSLLLDNLDLALQKLKITHASFVPSLVDSASLEPGNLPDLQYMSVGGEKITQKIIDTWSRSQVTLANAYGPTEATIGCCFKKVEPTTSVRNIGSPLQYTSTHVLRFGTMEYALRGTSGELCLSGDLVANGYHKRPDAKGFVEDFHGRRMYRTGDRVRMLADGSLEFLGRNDDQTKIRGQRIELGEVSETVRAAVGEMTDAMSIEAVSMILKHPSLARPRLVAFVVAYDNPRKVCGEKSRVIDFQNSGLIGRIRTHCSSVLPSYMMPDHIIRLTSLPLVAISRKIDNKRLKALFSELSVADLLSQSTPSPSSRRALTEAEDVVKDVAAEVLLVDRTKIQADTNLFHLGLDSLSAISFTIRLQKTGYDSTVSKILKTPSIESIARLPRRNEPQGSNVKQNSWSNLKRRFVTKSKNGHDFSDVVTVMPCMPLQETLIASSLDSEGGASYVNHVFLRLAPNVDHQRLIQAWVETAQDHEILRTCFRGFEGHFVQVILEKSHLTCEQFEQSVEDDELSFLRQRKRANTSDVLTKITSSPPLRLTLISPRSEKLRSTLLISIHHSLYDAESFSMILSEVYARYQRTSISLVRTPLAALVEFIESQNQHHAMTFWEAYLSEYKSSLFPYMSMDEEPKTRTKVLASPLSQIDRLAAFLSGTPASMIQALFGVVLAENLSTNDIVFGNVLSGRTIPVENADTILAPCLNTIPQRVQFKAESRLKSVVASAQQGFIDSIEYQHTALRDIHRWLKAEKPLFDTLFSYTRKRKAEPWSDLWHEIESSMPSEFPLTVEVVADQKLDQVTIRCEFTIAFGTGDRAEVLLSSIEELLQSLSAGENPILAQSRLMNGHAESHDPEVVKQRDWTEDETTMRYIIADIVGLAQSKIERNTSFFALGLDSIIAIQFVRRLRESGLRCSSAEVMRYPSISELGSHIFSTQRQGSDADRAASQSPKLASDPETQDTYPCTPLQSSMLTQTLGSDGSLYVHHHAVRLSKEVTLSTMKKAWEVLVSNTEILRTSFRFSERSRSWLGKVHKGRPMAWYEHGPNMKLESLMQEVKTRIVFRETSDFSKPPWEVDVIGNIWMLSLHHSLYDGESLGILLHDIACLCREAQIPSRPPFSLAARAIHRCNYEAEKFWAQTLDDFTGIAAPPNNNSFHEVIATLSHDLPWVLKSCKRLGVTLQSIALLAFGKTLAWLSGLQDIVFGHIVRGRSLPLLEADDIVGPLFNTVPHRVNLRRMAGCNKDAAQGVQDLSGKSLPHQHASLSRIQQIWREQIGDTDAVLFDTLFVFQKRSPGVEDPHWMSVDVGDNRAPTEYSTNFEVEQRDNEIALCINSRSVKDLDAFLRTFEQILNDILEAPDSAATAVLNNMTPKLNRIVEPEETTQPLIERSPETSDDVLESIRTVVAEVSGIPVANIADDASIFSLGLDSLSAIQIAAVGRRKGLSLSVADVLQGRTVKAIAQRLPERRSEAATKSNDTELASSQSHEKSLVPIIKPADLEFSRSDAITLAGLPDGDVEAILPCLPGQIYHLAMWLKSSRTLGEATFTYACKHHLNLDRLLNTWRKLRGRHSILRTTFAATSDRRAVQIILKSAAIRSDAFQCIPHASADQDSITPITRQEASRHFDLFSPPVELLLVQGKDVDHVILRLHHALYDAWTIGRVIQDLSTLNDGDEIRGSLSSSTLIGEALQSSSPEASQDYWRESLRDCQPTILRHSHQLLRTSCDTFYLKQTIPNLHQLEKQSQQHDTSLPTVILIAFARTVAHFTSIPSPTFGLFQAGRSSSIEELNEASFPCLNVTPLMVHDVSTRDVKDLIKGVSSDLAARVPFEQTYLHDILPWMGIEGKSLFNTFVNILWSAETMSQADTAANDLLSPYVFENIEDIVPTQRVPGKTAADGLDTSMLADGNLFLDVQKCSAEDSMRVVIRCDQDVLSEEEARRFLAMFADQVGKIV